MNFRQRLNQLRTNALMALFVSPELRKSIRAKINIDKN